MSEQERERLAITSGDAEQPFEWSMGKHTSRFLAELRDNKRIVAIRCPSCQKVYVPPRGVCGECFVPTDEIVELSGKGSVGTFTILSFGFVDPSTGKEKAVPYTWGLINLDGADNTFIHYIEETDKDKVHVGMRVKAVFEEERQGALLDIRHFATIAE